jgi:hypothetical protein
MGINNYMAIQTADYLKTRFEKGDLPSQEDFSDLIDSSINSSISGNVTFFDSVTANKEIFCNNLILEENGIRYKITVTNGNLNAVVY